MIAVKMYNSFLQLPPCVCQYSICCTAHPHPTKAFPFVPLHLRLSTHFPKLSGVTWRTQGHPNSPLIRNKEYVHTFPTGFPFLKSILAFLFQHTLDIPAVPSYTVLEIKLCQILLQNGSVYSKIQHNPRGKSKLGLYRMLAAAHYFSPFQFLTKCTALKKRDLISANKFIHFGSEYFNQATLKL